MMMLLRVLWFELFVEKMEGKDGKLFVPLRQ